MSGSVTILYGAVITPVDSRTWKALPMCLMEIGSTGNIDWILDYVEENQLEEALSQKGLATSQVVYLKDGEFIIPGFIDTHTVCACILFIGLSVDSSNTSMLVNSLILESVSLSNGLLLLYSQLTEEEVNMNCWTG